jgi:hypothetical protein
MKNASLYRSRRIYAPRSTVLTRRIQVGIDPAYLARCKALDDAQNKTDAAYVLEVYLEGQAQRRRGGTAAGALEGK